MIRKTKIRRKARKQKESVINPCRVCSLTGYAHCTCPGEYDEASLSVTPQPKLENRDVYARLRTLVESYEAHLKVNPWECERQSALAARLYPTWKEMFEKLEQTL